MNTQITLVSPDFRTANLWCRAFGFNINDMREVRVVTSSDRLRGVGEDARLVVLRPGSGAWHWREWLKMEQMVNILRHRGVALYKEVHDW